MRPVGGVAGWWATGSSRTARFVIRRGL